VVFGEVVLEPTECSVGAAERSSGSTECSVDSPECSSSTTGCGASPTELWRPNFDWITPALAVGGAFPCERTAELVRDHGFGALVDLREEACDDEVALAGFGVAFLHLPTEDLHPPTLESLERGVTFAEEHLARGLKVLIHCEHGIGRSAVLALCVLSRHGYEPLAALQLAKDRRWRVSPSPTQYEGWARWLRREGHEPPDFDTFGRIAYRHLATT
jgi:hypothetical protein